MFINPEEAIERLTAEFQENKARIWADEAIPLEEKDPEIYRLWREFDKQRTELQSASPREATAQEGHASSRRMILPRRRLPLWK
jgi:hypothetical protein